MISKEKGRRYITPTAKKCFIGNKKIAHNDGKNKLKKAINVPGVMYHVLEFYDISYRKGQNISCPWRKDRTPSLSIFGNGVLWKDHGDENLNCFGGRGLKAIDFIRRHENLTNVEACKRFLQILGEGGIWNTFTETESSLCAPKKKYEIASEELVFHSWDFLDKGIEADVKALSELRGIDHTGLQLAIRLGLLRFFTSKDDKRCYCITDSARYVRQDRTLDGSKLILKNGCEAKSRTIGKASWPVGLANVGKKQVILFVEGSPDLLAAILLICVASRQKDTAAVSMLGAKNAIHPYALKYFYMKRVRLFPDYDEAGVKGAALWEMQLLEAGAFVDVYDFGGLIRDDGKPVKDMNDFLRVDVDQWETDSDIRSFIPEPLQANGGAA